MEWCFMDIMDIGHFGQRTKCRRDGEGGGIPHSACLACDGLVARQYSVCHKEIRRCYEEIRRCYKEVHHHCKEIFCCCKEIFLCSQWLVRCF